MIYKRGKWSTISRVMLSHHQPLYLWDLTKMRVSLYKHNLTLCVNLFTHFLDEDLIKWGWPEDVWFHVDKVSSAHVYLRLRPVNIIYIRYKLLKDDKTST